MARREGEKGSATRAKIVHTASRLLRAHGIQDLNVTEVMEVSGLTHGGFYHHFKSKNELIETAIEAAMDEMLVILAAQDKEHGLRGIIASYLSLRHCKAHADGCAFAALITECLHEPERLGRLVTRKRKAYVELIAASLSRESGGASCRKDAETVFGFMVGALIFARTQGSDAKAEEFLNNAARQLETLYA